MALGGGVYRVDASAGNDRNHGNPATLHYAALHNYGGTLAINGALTGYSTGAAGTDQKGGEATTEMLIVEAGSTVTVTSGTTANISGHATGGSGSNKIADASSHNGDGGNATTFGVQVNDSNLSGVFGGIEVGASGGNGGLALAAADTAYGDGGNATAIGIQANNSTLVQTATVINIEVLGGDASTGVTGATTCGTGGYAKATGVNVTNSKFTHTYDGIRLYVTGGDGSGNTADRSGSGAATANGLVLTNATTKGSVSVGLNVSATAGSNSALTSVDSVGLAKAAGLQVSGGVAEEAIDTIGASSLAGETIDKVGAAESTGVLVTDKGKLQLTTTGMNVSATAVHGDDSSNTDSGTATATAIRGEADTVLEVIGGNSGLTISAEADAIANNAGTNGTALATAISGTSNEMSFKTNNAEINISAVPISLPQLMSTPTTPWQ